MVTRGQTPMPGDGGGLPMGACIITPDPESCDPAYAGVTNGLIATNSSELHLQGVALRSQYSDPAPEVVTLQ